MILVYATFVEKLPYESKEDMFTHKPQPYQTVWRLVARLQDGDDDSIAVLKDKYVRGKSKLGDIWENGLLIKKVADTPERALIGVTMRPASGPKPSRDEGPRTIRPVDGEVYYLGPSDGEWNDQQTHT